MSEMKKEKGTEVNVQHTHFHDGVIVHRFYRRGVREMEMTVARGDHKTKHMEESGEHFDDGP